MSTLGKRVLDLAEQQGLLDGKAIAEFRRQVVESKFVISPEAIAKVLVDHGHLTAFQARRLVSQAQGNEPDPTEQRIAEKQKSRQQKQPEEDLTFADDDADRPPAGSLPQESEDIVELEPINPVADDALTTDDLSLLPDDARPPRRKGKAAPIPAPVEGSTADDIVPLEPVDVSRPTRGSRWKTDAPQAPLNETVEMNPLDIPPFPAKPLAARPFPAQSPGDNQTTIDDLFEGTSLGAAAPAEPVLEPSEQPARTAKKKPAAAPSPSNRPAGRQPASRPAVANQPVVRESPLEAAPQPRPSRPVVVVPARNSAWDSPLLLIGGGILGVILIAFGILLYALTRGSAAEMFGRAEEEYRGGSYASAITIYEKFAQQYPQDPNASLARVRRGMALLRQVTDDGKNPRLGLQTAQQVLPEIENEGKFSEARSELATILPEIAEGLATEAGQATAAGKRDELAKLAHAALELLNNPNYLPASLRKEREGRIARVVDKLQVADRGIQQDRDLASAVTKITSAADEGEAAAAYAAQRELLASYPALETNPQLVAAMRHVGEKERELVKAFDGGPAPLTQDVPAASQTTALAFRAGAPLPDGGQPAFVLVEGGVYGLDAASGRVLWRRFVGYQSTTLPMSIAAGGARDAVVLDARRHELARLRGQTGELVWRLPLGAPAVGMAASDQQIVVTTRQGQVLSVDAATGNVLRTAQLPQGANVAASHSGRGTSSASAKLYQLGEHSTLFVLDGKTLACSETVYLGHKSGAIFVPPVAVREHVLVIESTSDDSSALRVLAPDPKTNRLAQLGRPQRLKGRVVNPPAVSGSRVAVITDRGQVAVYEVDPASQADHLRLIAGLDASESVPLPAFCELDKSQLWVAMRRRSMFEVQASLQQLARRFTENEDDAFLAPPQLLGEVQVLVRRRKGAPGVLVEGVRPASVETIWTTHLAAPVVALAGGPSPATVHALTAEGRLFSIDSQAAPQPVQEKATFSPAGSTAAIFATGQFVADSKSLVWTQMRAGGQAYVATPASPGQPAVFALPGRAAAAAAELGGGIVVPLAEGGVMQLARSPSDPKAVPFLPQLAPDDPPVWTQPVPLADQKTCLISDRTTIYALALKSDPQPNLTAIGQSRLPAPLVSPLALAGSTVFGVIRAEASDALVGFDRQAASAFEPTPLVGRVRAGPFAVGGLVLVEAEPDGLVCFGPDGKIRWQQPLEHGPVAGPPVATADGLVLVGFQEGSVGLVDPASGKELARQEVGQPLLGALHVAGDSLFAVGSDGVVHRIPRPVRP